MVKRKPKEQDAPQATGGWGNPQPHPDPENPSGNGNISDNPEDRRPMDEGWDEAEARQRSEAAQEPEQPAEPAKAKGKSRKKDKPEQPADVPTAQGKVQRDHNGGEGSQLTSYVERLERLAEEKKTIADDMKEVMAEAKAEGYDTATLRKVMQRRKLGKEACDEMDAILDLYEQQVGFD